MPAIRFLLALAALSVAFNVSSTEISSNPEELRRLAERYELGRGVDIDLQQAFRLYCLAAAQGDVEASHNLGWMYFSGRGLRYDPDLAAGWFQRAADGGNQLSKNMLELLAGAEPRADPACLRWRANGQSARQQVAAWVYANADAYDLDPELVLAVIAAESAYDPRARSHKGASGLMQLMPDTARRFGVDDIWDPGENMHGGMSYLRWLLQRYEGDVRLALAAYNAGESAVDHYHGIPPYAETEQYLRRIGRIYPKIKHPVPEAHPAIAMAK